MSHISKKEGQFCESCKKRFNYLSSFFLLVHFFRTFSKKKINSLSLFSESSFLWVILKKKIEWYSKRGSILWVIFNKKVQPLESNSKKCSSLWVIFKKGVQPFESYKKHTILWVKLKKNFNSLSHNGTQEKLNSWSHTAKRLQLFESYWEEVHKKRFNPISHFKRVQFFESYSWKEEVQFFDFFQK